MGYLRTLFLAHLYFWCTSMNDIGGSLRHFSASLFVDDALLFCLIHNLSNGQMSGLWHLILLSTRWFCLKGHLLLKAIEVYTIYSVPLAVAYFFKYQGVCVLLDMHIDEIISRAYQRLGMIKRVLYRAFMIIKRITNLTPCRPL